MRLIGIVSIVAMLWSVGTAAAEERVGEALKLFEQVCLPIVISGASGSGNDSGVQTRESGAPNANKVRSWRDRKSGFTVEVQEYKDGRVTCDLSDRENVLSNPDQLRLEAEFSQWMVEKMLMLVEEVPEQMVSFDYFNTWMDLRYPLGDKLRWGVLHTRFGSDLGSSSNLTLAYVRRPPTS